MKGETSKYRPMIGEECLISGENMDDENGYVFKKLKVLWKNKTLVLYGKDGCWPSLSRWDHIICKPFNQEI